MTKKIVCAVDFSEGSDAALAQAAELARVMDAELDLLHVFAVPTLALPEAPVSVSPTYVANLTSRAQHRLDADRARLEKQGLRVTTHLIEGNPADAIVTYAKQVGASILVLATQGRKGLQRLLLGSVAERVVRTACVPVLTVRAKSEPALTGNQD
jgi:nucleotide-binding universal stress UspA family protein